MKSGSCGCFSSNSLVVFGPAHQALAVSEDAKVDEDAESDSEDEVPVAPIKKSNVRLIVDMLESRLQMAVGRATQRFQEQQKDVPGG